jgi:hypothetical protein
MFVRRVVSSSVTALRSSPQIVARLVKVHRSQDQPSTDSSLHAGGGQAAIASFVCGGAAEQVLIEGSAIAVSAPLDKMTRSLTLTLTAKNGRQKPEAFEVGALDTLLATLGGASAERAALSVALSAAGEEPLELKALA